MTSATIVNVSAVKINKEFRVPGIGFCSAKAGHELFIGASDFHLYRCDLDTQDPKPEKLSDHHHDSYVTGLVHREQTLISSSYDGSLIWWDASSGDIRHRVPEAHSRWIRRLAVSPDGRSVASVGDDMKTRLWNAETSDLISEWGGYELLTPHGYPSMLYAVAFSPDGNWLATGNRTGQILVRDVQTGSTAATLETPVMYTWDPKARRHSIGGIRSLAFSTDSRLLAVGGIGKIGNIDHLGGKARLEVFDWQSGERKHEIENDKYKGLVEQIAFGPDDTWIVTAGGDHGGFVSLYDAESGKVLAQEKTPMHVHDFELSDDQSTLLAVGHEKACVVSIS